MQSLVATANTGAFMERKKYYLIVYLPELDPDPEGTFGMCCGCYYDTLEEAETELQRWRSERRSRCPDECYQVVEAHLTEDELFNLADFAPPMRSTASRKAAAVGWSSDSGHLF